MGVPKGATNAMMEKVSPPADFPLLRMKKSKRPMYKPTMESSDNTAVRKPVAIKKPAEMAFNKTIEPLLYKKTLTKIEKKVKYKPKPKND